MSSKVQQVITKDDSQENQPVAARTRRLSSNNCSNTCDLLGDQNFKREPISDNPHGVHLDGTAQIFTIEELTKIYEKDPLSRTEEDLKILDEYAFMLPDVKASIKYRQAREIQKQRILEYEEPLESIEEKASKLAHLIRESNHVLIYTGAGISTSAMIPDYRGENGLWTQIQKTGTFSMTKVFDLTQADPTYTHMAIKELCERRVVKHVVSQNCDGLHLRSGIPQSYLSEIHGNMYIEVCPTCEKQYFRDADITGRTARFRHRTGRKCHTCPEPNNNLIDTIVLYGERSRTKWPMNWERASKAAKRADLIICIGSSLKTLRRYECLWPKTISGSSSSSSSSSMSTSKRGPKTKLVIVNLQYTSKDKNAVLKINGKCDLVMSLVMEKLNIGVPIYDWRKDQLHKLTVPFTNDEYCDLKRSSLFEVRTSESPIPKWPYTSSSSTTAAALAEPGISKSRSGENRESPSLFVSELTDDPEKKALKIRIRAVNLAATGSCESSGLMEASTDKLCSSLEGRGENLENGSGQAAPAPLRQQSSERVEITLPGWLGKGLGRVRSRSYRRKRHGNKGRKHNTAASEAVDVADQVQCDEIVQIISDSV